MSNTVKYVGQDIDKNTLAGAVAEAGKPAEMREHGEIVNSQGKPEKVPETSGLASLSERPRLAVSKLKRPYRYRVCALIGNLIAATKAALMRQ